VDQSEALSWQELKLAAEAGFEELLKHQEAAAEAELPQQNWRRPGMSRPKGGTPNVSPAAVQQTTATERGQTAGQALVIRDWCPQWRVMSDVPSCSSHDP